MHTPRKLTDHAHKKYLLANLHKEYYSENVL